MLKLGKWAALAALLLGTSAVYAGFATYGFSRITNNDPGNAGYGETHFFMDVFDQSGASQRPEFSYSLATNQVAFLFRNTGTNPLFGILGEVYFDDGSLVSQETVVNAPQPAVVDYHVGADPKNLSGGAAIGFFATKDFGYADEPSEPEPLYGVGAGEWVAFVFNINKDLYANEFDAVVGNLAQGDPNTGLRIGFHVRSLYNGKSESYVDNPDMIPAPAAIGLAGVGLALVGWARRRLSAS